MKATTTSPEQTEDSVVWFALLAKARQDGNEALLAEAKAKLSELGISIELTTDNCANIGGSGDA